MTSLKNIAKPLTCVSLILTCLFMFGCHVPASRNDANEPIPGAPAASPNALSISLSKTTFETDLASYTWKVKSGAIKSVEFGASKLDVAPGQPVESINLDLKVLTSGDQILASITIESKDKSGPTFTTTSSNIGTDKGQDIRKLIVPLVDLRAVQGGTMVAKGVGAFPSLILHLN